MGAINNAKFNPFHVQACLMRAIAVPVREETVEVFLSLGRDAVPGRLKNSAVNHDRYLYGNPE